MVVHLYAGVSFPYQYLIIQDMHVEIPRLFRTNEHELLRFVFNIIAKLSIT